MGSEMCIRDRTQLEQLAITIGKREEGKLPTHPIQNPKGQQFEQLKAVMVLRSGKEVDNKVSEKKYDKDEGLKTMESDLEIEKENNLSPSPVVPDPIVTYEPRVPCPQALDAPFSFQERHTKR